MTIIIILAVSFAVLASMLAIIVFRYLRYKFIGSVAAYIAISYLVCLTYALYANFNPMPTMVEGVLTPAKIGDPWIVVATSLFDALKMMAVAFDKEKIGLFIESEEFINRIFGYGYVTVSATALFCTSLSVIISYAHNFVVRASTAFRTIFGKKDIIFLFTDTKVTITSRLAEELKKDGHVVIVYLSRASQKTQEGTEYKDNLLSKGIDTRVEVYGRGIADLIFNRGFTIDVIKNKLHLFNKNKARKRYVYGLFSEDDSSIDMANHFKKAVTTNSYFKKIRRSIYFDVNYRNEDAVNDLINDLKDKKIGAYITLSNIIGIDKVINSNNKVVASFVKRNKISDDSLGYLLSHFDNNIESVINPDKKLDKWSQELYRLLKSPETRDRDIDPIENFKIFLTYQDSDIDISNGYSVSTLQIINTLSEYDMISSDFILNNQITNFVKIDKDNLKDIDKENKYMHVTFVGFGKINRPIFNKMTFAYQLWGDNTNKVNYHILDMYSDSFVETSTNDYTNIAKAKESTTYLPYLYSVKAECSGQDLTNYRVIENYIEEAFKDENRFNDKGFEIFVISVMNTTTSVQIAISLRKAISKFITDTRKALKTVIFVKIGNTSVSESYFSNCNFIKSQQSINDGFLFDESKGRTVAPIVSFGENALMSKYISSTNQFLTDVGKTALEAYHGKEKVNLIRKDWLLSGKNSVLVNTMPTFSIKPKLALLGYHLDKDFHLVEKGFKEYIESVEALKLRSDKEEPLEYNDTNYPQNIKCLAQLEHNRWLVSNYIVHQSNQWGFDEFKKSFEIKKGKPYFKSKSDGYAKHVGMITNEGLIKLRDEGIEKWKEIVGDNEELYLAAKVGMYKFTLTYDTNAMRCMFEVLQNPEHEQK